VPFHLIWISMALVYGLQPWHPGVAFAACAVTSLLTGLPLANHALADVIGFEELTEVPLMSGLFLVMVWHVRSRSAALAEARSAAARERAAYELNEQFVRFASHELRTALTVARGYAELLRDDVRHLRLVDEADVILDELNKLERLAGSLLALAWAHQPGRLDADVVNVMTLVRRVARRWAPVAKGSLTVDIAPARVLGNEERLETALDCLVENAVRHTSDRTSIVLRAYEEGEWVVIEVEDDGPGIPEQRRSQLSGPRTSAAHPGRSGLGLAIVRGVTEAHGGRLALSPGSVGGLRATLMMPATTRLPAIPEPTGAK
jgi:two-component system OmpR family sensor kinase